MSATLITGTRAWPTLRVNHELAFPALALLLLSIAAFVVQGFAGLRLLQSRRRSWWLVVGASIPLAVLGMLLVVDSVAHAQTISAGALPVLRPFRYADEVTRAIVIALSTTTVCCLLSSNAAVIHAIASVAAVPHAARGASVRVGFWSGLIALLLIGGIEAVWRPMRWASLPAGWVPAGVGFLAAMLGAFALSGHHVAEDTLRASLPPGKSREQRIRHLEVGRSIRARAANVQAELVVVLGAVLASAIFAGMVTELAAFRGMLLAIADRHLPVMARVDRIASSFSYVSLPLVVHVLHAVPALAVALSLAAMSPARWGLALRLAGPGLALAIGGAAALGVGVRWLEDEVPRAFERQSLALENGESAVVAGVDSPLPLPEGGFLHFEGTAISVDGKTLTSEDPKSQAACQRVAGALVPAFDGRAPAISVAEGVPYGSLRCVLQALSSHLQRVSWLVKPQIATTLPQPWMNLAQPPGVVTSALKVGAPDEPLLELEATSWKLRLDSKGQPLRLEGSFEERIVRLRERARHLKRIDVQADDELVAEVVLRAVASIAADTKVSLIVASGTVSFGE